MAEAQRKKEEKENTENLKKEEKEERMGVLQQLAGAQLQRGSNGNHADGGRRKDACDVEEGVAQLDGRDIAQDGVGPTGN
jgi:hypothetical protein